MARTQDPGAESGVAGCPVAHWFKPGETSAHPDPFPWYKQAREQGRVFFAPSGEGDDGMYVVTRYEEITQILRDTTTYSNVYGMGENKPVPAEIVEQAGPGWTYPGDDHLTLLDPPKHTRQRKLLNPSFTPKRLAVFEDVIREKAHARIDAFADQGHCDLGPDFAYQIPNKIIAPIMGASDEAADRFVVWLEAFLRMRLTDASPEQQLQDWRDLFEQDQYNRSLLAARRAHPENDLLTDMIQATSEDGEPMLTDYEILANLMGTIGAGSGTSAIMILHTTYLLLTHPEQFAEVKADPDLIPVAIEEALRLRGTVRGIIRTTTQDTELGGVPIPKGARVYALLASANHDEEVFDEPDRYNIHRPELKQHLAFSKWTHFCIGAPLARLEGRVAIGALIERLPNLRLAPDYERDFAYENNPVVSQLKSLRVAWD